MALGSVTDRTFGDCANASFLALLARAARGVHLDRHVAAHVSVVPLLGDHMLARGESGVPRLTPVLAKSESMAAFLRRE